MVRFLAYCTLFSHIVILISKIAILFGVVIPFTDRAISLTFIGAVDLCMTYLITFKTLKGSFTFGFNYCLKGYAFLFFSHHLALHFFQHQSGHQVVKGSVHGRR
jgi:hypothetical protein